MDCLIFRPNTEWQRASVTDTVNLRRFVHLIFIQMCMHSSSLCLLGELTSTVVVAVGATDAGFV